MAKTNLHVPDYLILPFGRAVKSDLQRITLSAVSADGLYLNTNNVPVIFIRKAEKRPICIGDFQRHIGIIPKECWADDDTEQDQLILDHMCTTLKSHNPNMTRWEEMFLNLYFKTLKVLRAGATLTTARYEAAYSEGTEDETFGDEVRTHTEILIDAQKKFGLPLRWSHHTYNSPFDIWRALLPIPELQLYVKDPLATTLSYQPNNNFRVDYGFWDGQKLIAVEIDGAEPAGYARDIRRDRLLKRAGVEVIHILNMELAKHGAHALVQLLPRTFFGYDWDYEGVRPFPA